jgi:hypothetical protein
MRDAICQFAPQSQEPVAERKFGAPPMKWPQLKNIQVGGFFFVELDRAQAARQAACNYGNRHQMVFRSKKYGSFVRIERVA